MSLSSLCSLIIRGRDVGLPCIGLSMDFMSTLIALRALLTTHVLIGINACQVTVRIYPEESGLVHLTRIDVGFPSVPL